MTMLWQKTVEQLEAETLKLSLECPDDIKRFHYGLITHSDAGKYSYNQYLGHYVHLYGWFFSMSDFVLPSIVRYGGNPIYSLEALKDMLHNTIPTEWGWAGQYQMGELARKVLDSFGSIETREQFVELAKAWNAYVSRRYWWLHWYFPWGAGPAICPRISAEDVREMARLLETA